MLATERDLHNISNQVENERIRGVKPSDYSVEKYLFEC